MTAPLALVRAPVTTWTLRVVTAGGLAVDAWIHADLAHRYDLNAGSAISQGTLFRLEAVIATAAAVAILLSGRRLAWAFAALVAGSAFVALLLFYVYDGTFGPLPNMYEPVMYPEKTAAAVAEAVALVTALAGLASTWAADRRPRRRR